MKAWGSSFVPWRDPYSEQTQIGYFWSGNTIAIFEGMIRGLVGACEMGSEQRYCGSLSRLGDSARLFALANLAGADAGIRAWNSKKYYNFWRPITAIQQLLPGDNDGNPQTEADAKWTSLIATPPYPDTRRAPTTCPAPSRPSSRAFSTPTK